MEYDIEQLKEEFLRHFEDPVESQPVEGGSYHYLVTPYDTADAIREVLPDLPPKVFAELESELSQTAVEWISTEEWNEFHEEDEPFDR